jgi:ribosomal protein S24E
MEVKILSKKNNALFNRIELVAEVTGFNATPSRKEVSELLCTALKCEANRLVIREVHQPFGSKKVTVTASVYDSIEKAKEFEREYIFKRGVPKASPAAG